MIPKILSAVLLGTLISVSALCRATCDADLRFTSLRDVEKVMKRNLHRVRVVPADDRVINESADTLYLRAQIDLKGPGLWLLEPPREPINENELQTARDFAARRDLPNEYRFLFFPDYHGRSTPRFDGIEFDGQGRPVRNVSLKYGRRINPKFRPTYERHDLRESLRARLFREQESSKLSLTTWYQLDSGDGAQDVKRFLELSNPKKIRHAVELASILGIGLRPNGHRRPFHLVVDLRESGYPHAFVDESWVRGGVQEVVDESCSRNDVLTLLWAADRTMTFKPRLIERSTVDQNFGHVPLVTAEALSPDLTVLGAENRASGRRLASITYRLMEGKAEKFIQIENFRLISPGQDWGKGLEEFMLKSIQERHPSIREIVIHPRSGFIVRHET